jgi:hypothetical protein
MAGRSLMRTSLGIMMAGVLLAAGCGGDPAAERDPESESTDGASATPAPTPDPTLDLTGPADPAAKREFAQAMRATLLEGTGSFQHRLMFANQGGIHDRGRYDLEASTTALTRVAEAGTDRVVFQMVSTHDRLWMRADDQQESWGCWAEFGSSELAAAAGVDGAAMQGVPGPVVAVSWGKGHHRDSGGIVGSTDLSVAIALLGAKAAAAYAVPPTNHDVAPVTWRLRDGFVVALDVDLVAVDAAARQAGFEPTGEFVEVFEAGLADAVTATAWLDPGPIEPVRSPDPGDVVVVGRDPDVDDELDACAERR